MASKSTQLVCILMLTLYSFVSVSRTGLVECRNADNQVVVEASHEPTCCHEHNEQVENQPVKDSHDCDSCTDSQLQMDEALAYNKLFKLIDGPFVLPAMPATTVCTIETRARLYAVRLTEPPGMLSRLQTIRLRI